MAAYPRRMTGSDGSTADHGTNDTTDWGELSQRAGLACHDLVGWMLWDPAAVAAYEQLGVPNGRGWAVAWRLASLGRTNPAVAAAGAYSIHPDIVSMVMGSYLNVTEPDAVLAVRDAAVITGLDEIAPGLSDQLGAFADDLWRGVDAVHLGARPMFAAHRARPRDPAAAPALSAWLAANCLRELRGDNHWALCASEDLDDVEVGLLHSVMVDVDEYGGEEWIARSRGANDDLVAAGWARLAAKGWADIDADSGAGRINDAGRTFRLDLERRTDALTAPAWEAVGADTAIAFCDAIDAHHDAFVARIDATAGPRWMPAVRGPR